MGGNDQSTIIQSGAMHVAHLTILAELRQQFAQLAATFLVSPRCRMRFSKYTCSCLNDSVSPTRMPVTVQGSSSEFLFHQEAISAGTNNMCAAHHLVFNALRLLRKFLILVGQSGMYDSEPIRPAQ